MLFPPPQVGVLHVRFQLFKFPGSVVGHVKAPAAEVKHGQDIRLQRVADHEEFAGLDVEVFDEFAVFRFFLFRHDSNVVKMAFRPGLRSFLTRPGRLPLEPINRSSKHRPHLRPAHVNDFTIAKNGYFR